MSNALTRRHILSLAWPIMLANAAVPLLGFADTAVLGHTGGASELGAIALGALIFNFLYWSFGFLRMGTTGFTAQAAGAGDEAEVRTALLRALLLGFGIGWLLILLGWPIRELALWLLNASERVEAVAADYLGLRIWGAPATLGTYALMGCFIGLGKSRHLLLTQLFLNGLNILLDVWFAGVLGWGARGIAIGTAIAEWCTLLLALGLAYSVLRARHRDQEPFWPWQRVTSRGALAKTLSSNADIMLRTLMLLLGFGWFTNQGASFGDITLAANHILLQFLAFSAFFLDGYAFVTEALVGTALGARSLFRFRQAVWRSTELAAVTALLLAGALLLFGDHLIHALTGLEAVRRAAEHSLPLAALYVACGFAAFQLDGIFIGATRTRAMRNASLLAILVFLAACWPLTRALGNDGLWLAFTIYVLARAATLGLYYPALERSVSLAGGNQVSSPPA